MTSDVDRLRAGESVQCGTCGRWVVPGDAHWHEGDPGRVVCGICEIQGPPPDRTAPVIRGTPEPVPGYPETGPGITLGWLQLDRSGEKPAAEVVCRDCGQGCHGGIWLQAIARGKGGVYWGGPYCDLCARTTD